MGIKRGAGGGFLPPRAVTLLLRGDLAGNLVPHASEREIPLLPPLQIAAGRVGQTAAAANALALRSRQRSRLGLRLSMRLDGLAGLIVRALVRESGNSRHHEHPPKQDCLQHTIPPHTSAKRRVAPDTGLPSGDENITKYFWF